MRKTTPKQVGDFTERLLSSGDYGRLIKNRFFRATVASVAQVGSGFSLTVIRNGELTTDGDFYQCLIPSYVPRVGDDVEMMWRDDANAVVAYPVKPKGFLVPRTRVYASAATSPATTAAVPMVLDTVDYDPFGDFNLTTSTYVAPYTGYYELVGAVGWALANAPTMVQFSITGFATRTATQSQGGNASGGGMGVRIVLTTVEKLVAGDKVQVIIRQDSGGVASTQTGNALSFFSAEWQGP